MSGTYIPAALRREVSERAQGCCEYCRLGEESYPYSFTIDHLIAEKHGGQTISDNLCLSCYWCNTYKGSDITSVDWASGGQIVPLYNPRQQRWDDHFRLQDVLIQPLTGTGRVTVSLLRLNAAERVEERELLLALDTYPCQ